MKMRMTGRKWKVSEGSAENSVSLLCEIISVLDTKVTVEA